MFLIIEWLLVIPIKPRKKKIFKLFPKSRLWKLKDVETAILFTREMTDRNDDVTKADDDQNKWLLMKQTWLKGVWNDERSTWTQGYLVVE